MHKPWIVVVLVLGLVARTGHASALKRRKSSRDCYAQLQCGDVSENLPITIQGMPGYPGLEGWPGPRGPRGPRGLMGPPGRDGFSERTAAFYAELQRLFVTDNKDAILRPWTLSDSFNVPDVADYFSEATGIFTVPKPGLYQFYVTLAVSRAKAVVYLSKNGQRMNTLWVESVIIIQNQTVAWGWSTGSVDSILNCQPGDQVAVVAAYKPVEQFNSEIYGYSYSTFSGYMLFND